jgi:hypothetical protein
VEKEREEKEQEEIKEEILVQRMLELEGDIVKL